MVAGRIACLTITSHGITNAICNVHLRPGLDIAALEQQLNRLKDQLGQYEEAIILGDMNCKAEGESRFHPANQSYSESATWRDDKVRNIIPDIIEVTSEEFTHRVLERGLNCVGVTSVSRIDRIYS